MFDYLCLKDVFAGFVKSSIVDLFDDGPGFAIALENQPAEATHQRLQTISTREDESASGPKVVRANYRIDSLALDMAYHCLPVSNAISLSGSITNQSAAASPRIQNPLSLWQAFSVAPDDRVIVNSLRGGRAHFTYPPISFEFRQDELISWLANHPSNFHSYHGGLRGRSTDFDMPYFVAQLGEAGGVFLALEWGGDWTCNLGRPAGGESVHCSMGIHGVDLKLLPGESIPIPACLIGVYEGDWLEGCNALRRTIVEHYLPRLDGKPTVPPVSYDHWFSLGLDCGEERMKEQAEACAKIGCEYVTLDAGWYEGTEFEGGNFTVGLGNWGTVNPTKYPNGLKPLSDHIRDRGMKFGLWFEPERCHPDSRLAREHPDWILPGNAPLVDFGNAEVVEWFKDTFDLMLTQNRVEWIRFDSNLDPQINWSRRDPDDRKGISQIRHFEGLYDFWDHLLVTHPTLCIEGCSSGGRRMDLASLKRSHTYWCNDHTEHPDLVRFDAGANLMIPANYLNHNVTLKSAEEYPPYVYHCHFGGCLGFGDKVSEWDEAKIQSASEHVRVYKEIRHLLMKNFKPLFPQPRTLDSWDGWQWHDPQTDEGVVIIFRVLSPDDMASPRLRWMDERAVYIFTDPYTGEIKRHTGKDLGTRGLATTLGERESKVWRYDRA